MRITFADSECLGRNANEPQHSSNKLGVESPPECVLKKVRLARLLGQSVAPRTADWQQAHSLDRKKFLSAPPVTHVLTQLMMPLRASRHVL